MFGLTIEKVAVIAVIAVFIIGPDRLPLYVGRIAAFVRGLRDLGTTAKSRIREELGDDYDTIEWQKLDPRQYDPRRIVREALSDSAAGSSGSAGAGAGAGAGGAGAGAGAGAASDVAARAPRGDQPLPDARPVGTGAGAGTGSGTGTGTGASGSLGAASGVRSSGVDLSAADLADGDTSVADAPSGASSAGLLADDEDAHINPSRNEELVSAGAPRGSVVPGMPVAEGGRVAPADVAPRPRPRPRVNSNGRSFG
jgi:sec-independent protein translocase protein TatB